MTLHSPVLKFKPQQGFSLIETLVSLTIVALSLIVLLQIFSSGLNRSVNTEETYKAALFAQSLEAAIGREVPLHTGLLKGESSEGYEWVIDIMPYDTSQEDILVQIPKGQLYTINIHVKYQSGIREKSLSYDVLRYGVAEGGL